MAQAPLFGTSFFWGVESSTAVIKARDDIVAQFKRPMGLFASDNLIAFGRNLGFLNDKMFMDAWAAHATAPHERGILWRTAVLVWAARQGLRLDGDFVECGCYKGVSARIVADTIAFKDTDRAFYLYDVFEHDSSMPHHAMPEHSADLFTQVKKLFEDIPTAHVIKGFLPESLEQGEPSKIAFMHIDLNNAEAEIATLEALWERMVPGSILVLDDFGASPYRRTHLMETDWFAARGYSVLELPTSQGIVIK
ncbi:MAG: class I SAM-dependent methyltransferase [Phenylobacterium sp.]|uniref:class I SAM-dependent methyltransferase n=1 Tax=Phenylobacterium sp. TaxID=1871053 RepID=UPI002724AF14|nr:class I SAM-dependent methyltransferase [Phenylobacterium sp.]MDO9430062.1 class I SAM-dependent methyltransferase [Phenylobacterium sp.]